MRLIKNIVNRVHFSMKRHVRGYLTDEKPNMGKILKLTSEK